LGNSIIIFFKGLVKYKQNVKKYISKKNIDDKNETLKKIYMTKFIKLATLAKILGVKRGNHFSQTQ